MFKNEILKLNNMHINSDIKVIVSREVYYDLSDWAKSNLKNDASFSIGENRMEIITRGSKYIIELIDGGKKLSQKRYLEHIKDHLTEYKKNTFPELPDGVFKRNSKTHYPYILPLKDGKIDAVKQYNTLKCIADTKTFLLTSEQLHIYAHHLNSSQMVCYNFFRPFISEEGTPTRELFSILQTVGIPVSFSDNARCFFEYEQEEREWQGERTNNSKGTNFDFYLRSGDVEIFFEIKYTEDGFGIFQKDKNELLRHQNKYDSFYSDKLANCPALKKKVEYGEEFRKNYQLLRNTIRATSRNKYVVFVYDANNPHAYNQLNQFLSEYIADEYKKNVVAIEWQKLVLASHPDQVFEFWNKYLNYEL